MPRIVFISPFAKTEISGGIKTVYRHAEILAELGFDAAVFQPEGPPSWFETRAKVLPRFTPATGDVLVFPEVLNGGVAELAQLPTTARKVLFCQNQYYMALNPIGADRLGALGFSRFACSSKAAQQFLESVLHIDSPTIIPYHVDPQTFFPRRKIPQIAFVPRKMPREASLVASVLRLKYAKEPRVQAAQWQIVDNKSERETAEILGGSSIFLSLSFFESFGLVPVEAMASGCIVAGFDGYGGREYATAENGFWFPPDHVEELADALAGIAVGLEAKDAKLENMREAGFATAARYSKARTRDALREFYSSLVKQ